MDISTISDHTVVAAVDGSEHSRRAVDWAARHAQLAGWPLTLLHAAGSGGVLGSLRGERGGSEHDQILDEAQACARAVSPDLQPTVLSAEGDPRQVLLDTSRRAGLLVMGSRGRGVVSSLLLGSVSAGVSQHAECPVAVVRGSADIAVRRVVVGADARPETRAVVAYAYALAALHRVPVMVVHAYWDVMVAAHGVRGQRTDDPEVADLEADLAELVAGLGEDHPDVVSHLVLRHGLVDTVLTADARPDDIIVVGRQGSSSPPKFLASSVSRAVVERASSTVVVVPEVAPPADRG